MSFTAKALTHLVVRQVGDGRIVVVGVLCTSDVGQEHLITLNVNVWVWALHKLGGDALMLDASMGSVRTVDTIVGRVTLNTIMYLKRDARIYNVPHWDYVSVDGDGGIPQAPCRGTATMTRWCPECGCPSSGE
jgi:hypothetical protein